MQDADALWDEGDGLQLVVGQVQVGQAGQFLSWRTETVQLPSHLEFIYSNIIQLPSFTDELISFFSADLSS